MPVQLLHRIFKILHKHNIQFTIYKNNSVDHYDEMVAYSPNIKTVVTG